MTIKCIILDCDGVILDSNQTYARMYTILFAKYGHIRSKQEIYEHFGESPEQIIHETFPHKDIKNIFKEYKKQLSDPKLNRTIKIHKGAKISIRSMRKTYRMAVVSGALHARLHHSLKKFGLIGFFDTVVGADDVTHGKPDPEALRKVLRTLRLKEHEVIFVGDAPNDLEAARRAGIRFIAVLSGVMDKRLATELKADYIVKDINRVQRLVEKINDGTA